MRFIRPLSTAGFALGLALSASPGSYGAEPLRPLVLERTIALKDVSGRIDHMAIDLARHHLFVAELGNGTVDVIDLATGTAIRRIDGLREPQGIGYSPSADVLAVASAGDGSAHLFRGADFVPAGIVDLGEDADDVRLDARTGNLVVGYGRGGLAVLDPVQKSVVSRIPLPGHPEGFELDPTTRRAIVNVPDAREIAVLDMATRQPIATWRLPHLRANFPMALNDSATVVATVFRNPARLVLLNAKNGMVLANQETCGDADDVFFDAKRHRIYVSCGAGAVDVLQQRPSGYSRLSRIETGSSARTSLFVPELDRLLIAVPAGSLGSGSGAAVLVFRPGA